MPDAAARATGFHTCGYWSSDERLRFDQHPNVRYPVALSDLQAAQREGQSKSDDGVGRDPVARAAVDLQRLLLKDSASGDVVSGTIHLPRKGGDEGSNAASTVDNPSGSDGGGALLCVKGQRFSIPLSASDAKRLYGLLDPSLVGIEREGTKLDETRRRSREVEVVVVAPSSSPQDGRGGAEVSTTTPPPSAGAAAADGEDRAVLPPCLQQALDAELESIRAALTPTAATLDLVPYKLIGYAGGDFFGPHVDSASHEDHVATLTVHLPCTTTTTAAGDGVDEPVSRVVVPPTTSAASTDHHVAASTNPCSAVPASIASSPAAVPDGAADDDEAAFARPGVAPGALTFYAAREVSDDALVGSWLDADDPAKLVRNRQAYDSPPAEEALEVTRDLADYSHVIPATTQPTTTTVPLNYAAWLTSVMHSVAPVQQGTYRFVVTYRVWRRGTLPVRIPRRVRDSVGESLDAVFRAMDDRTRVTAAAAASHVRWLMLGGGRGPRRPPDAVAVLLRHSYSPAALRPENLRGIDAVLYDIASRTRAVQLMSAVRCREGDGMATRWRVEEDPLGRAVVATWDPQGNVPSHEVGAAECDGGIHEALRLFPAVTGVAWVQLGHGRLLAGGYSAGNVDCAAPWWYRDGVMLIRPEPCV